MSLQRRNIRLACIAALSNSDAPPYPTMAESRVFDSRQDPLIRARQQDSMPCICVYTDSTERVPTNQGQPPFTVKQEIILELSLGNVGEEIQTDAESEYRLDEFEDQVITALFDYRTATGLAFQSTFKRVIKADSLRLANSDQNTRLAMRDLCIAVDYDGRCADITGAFPKFERLYANVANGDEQTAQVIEDYS